MPSTASQETPFLLRPAREGDAGWVLARHAAHYAAAHGFDARFEAAVAAALRPMPAGWIAASGAARIGCLFTAREGAALRLRLFYVDAPWRGRGVAQALFDRACRTALAEGAARLRVATHAEHAAAGRFYARNGLRRVAAAPVQAYGQALTEEHWEKPLA